MELYNNTEKINLNKGDIIKAKKLITDIYQSMEFFGNILVNDKLCKNDVHTHMGLFESYFSELSGILGYNSVIEEERKMRAEGIKEMSRKMQELEKEVGEDLSHFPEKISAALEYYTEAFCSWYESLGFHYASQEKINGWSIRYEFSEEVYAEAKSKKSSVEDKSLFGENTEYDVWRDRFHGDLLDTDNNRKLLSNLFLGNFPNSRIIGYNSRPGDGGKFVLRVQVIIPFSDLTKLSGGREEN